MEQKVIFDWKSCVAMGVAVAAIILVMRMPEDAVAGAFNHLVDGSKGLTIAIDSGC